MTWTRSWACWMTAWLWHRSLGKIPTHLGNVSRTRTWVMFQSAHGHAVASTLDQLNMNIDRRSSMGRQNEIPRISRRWLH